MHLNLKSWSDSYWKMRLQFYRIIIRCECNEGWTGVRCERSTQTSSPSPCLPDPCLGDCRCFPSCRHSNGYQCVSEGGYIGRNCSIRKLIVYFSKHCNFELHLPGVLIFQLFPPSLAAMMQW